MQIRNHPFTTLGQRDRPMLWVSISGSSGAKGTPPLLAKIDTGCDGCIFPLFIAKELGCDLSSAKKVSVETASTPTMAYRLDSMMIDVLKMWPDGLSGKELLCRILKVPIYFVKDAKQLILGAEGFLDRFVLTVDYPNRMFSLVTQDKNQ